MYLHGKCFYSSVSLVSCQNTCASTDLMRSLFTCVSGRPPGRVQWARTTAASLCASAACSNPETAGRCGETELRHRKDTQRHPPACFYDQTRTRQFTRKHLSHRVRQVVCECRDGRKKSGNDWFCRNTRLGDAWSEFYFFRQGRAGWWKNTHPLLCEHPSWWTPRCLRAPFCWLHGTRRADLRDRIWRRGSTRPETPENTNTQTAAERWHVQKSTRLQLKTQKESK